VTIIGSDSGKYYYYMIPVNDYSFWHHYNCLRKHLWLRIQKYSLSGKCRQICGNAAR
jgi:hypothetical protein